MNALQLCCWRFSYKETLQQTYFKRSAISHSKRPFCVFEPPLWVRDNVRCSSSAIGKRVVAFLLVLVELFARCYGRSDTSDYRLNVGVSKGVSLTQNFREKMSPTNHSSCYKNTKIHDLLCDIRMWAQVLFVLSQITRLTSRQTDGQASFSWLDRVVSFVSFVPFHALSFAKSNFCDFIANDEWPKSIGLSWIMLKSYHKLQTKPKQFPSASLTTHCSWCGLPYRRKPLTTPRKTSASDCRHVR